MRNLTLSSDVLTRHLTSHTQYTVLPAASSTRACKQCARDRVKCSRGSPCQRCLNRGSICQYPSRKAPQRDGTLQQDTNLLSNSIRSTDPLAPDLEVETSSLAPEFLPFPSVVNHTGAQSITWTNDYGDSNNICGFDQPDLSALGVNWLSPQYENDIDWDAILGGFTASAQIHQDSRLSEARVAMTAGKTVEYASDSLQQSHDILQHTPGIQHAQTCSTIVSATTPTSVDNIYYVDGTGARAPFGGRSHGRKPLNGVQAPAGFDHRVTRSSSPAISQIADKFCPQTAYDELLKHVSRERQHHELDFGSDDDFPSIGRLQLYVQHYFEEFHPIFPFVRNTAPNHSTPYAWLLLLAVTAVGSRYSQQQQQQQQDKNSKNMLATILDAALYRRRYGFGTGYRETSEESFTTSQGEKFDTHPNLSILQAGILNVIILQNSGRKVLVERALIDRHYLFQACNSLQLLSYRPPTESLGHSTNATELENVRQWLERETEIRVGMMIWVRRYRSPSTKMSLTFIDSRLHLSLPIQCQTSSGSR
jgi:hypothetical protein